MKRLKENFLVLERLIDDDDGGLHDEKCEMFDVVVEALVSLLLFMPNLFHSLIIAILDGVRERKVFSVAEEVLTAVFWSRGEMKC